MNNRRFRFFCGKFLFVLLLCVGSGCTPLVIGGGAAGGYKVATDERSTGRMFDDSSITAKVNAKMVESADVKARNIDIDTVDGEVILSGFVDSADEKSKATDLARSVEGVKGVRNDLQVGTRTVGQALDDKVLGSKIKGKLMQEPGVRSLNIDVDVYSGIVNLKGIVPNSEQKKIILDIARSIEGTKGIIDHIKVR